MGLSPAPHLRRLFDQRSVILLVVAFVAIFAVVTQGVMSVVVVVAKGSMNLTDCSPQAMAKALKIATIVACRLPDSSTTVRPVSSCFGRLMKSSTLMQTVPAPEDMMAVEGIVVFAGVSPCLVLKRL